MKYILAFLLLLTYSYGYTQQSDFLILKKKDRPVKYYYAGTQIEFVTTTNAYRNALITAIKDDSIYLQEFLVQRVPMTYGGFINDTVGSFRFTYHHNQVKSFGQPKKGFNVQGSGAALFGGGVLLTGASGVAYLIDKDKFSPELLGAAVLLGTAGYFMSRSGKDGMVIGKKYNLLYMDMTK